MFEFAEEHFDAVSFLVFDVLLVMGLLYYFYGPLLAVLSVLFVGAYFIVTNLFSGKIDREQKTYMEHIRMAFGKFFDSLMNYETVKCFGNEARVAQEFKNSTSLRQPLCRLLKRLLSWDTLTRLLFRLYDTDGGKILINGQDSKKYRIDSLRRHISIVPQDVALFNDTILRNIQFGNPEASFADIEAATQKAGIHTFILSLPEQYETMVGERGMKLSGGERQRIGIARAILKNPDLYIFDEATSSLDTKTEKEIQKNLLEISADKTALIIAHRLSTIVDCERILVMQDRDIVEHGAHEELLQMGGLYSSLWKAQSGGKAFAVRDSE